MPETGGVVVLGEGQSASNVFHAVLADAVAACPDVLQGVEFPEQAAVFRKRYGEVLPRFEAARAGSPERLNIARRLVATLQQRISWQDDQGERQLHEALTEAAVPLTLRSHSFDGAAGWQPSLVYRGERWEADRLAELGAVLVDRGMASEAVGEALRWLASDGMQDGALDLSGRKIVVLGAGAEMAPTRFWLEAGADVLWLDVAPPPEAWREVSGMAGRLFWPENNVDLLSQPREVLATINAFGEGAPLDLGLYAYAPGHARELLLTATMNSIIDALPRERLRTVTLLVSPTTPTALEQGDLAAMRKRFESRPGWESLLAGMGLFGRGGGYAELGNGAATRTVVAIQGGSYQAAQYLGKVMAAECWASGQDDSADQPVRVSANTAAITRTRSLDHPVFAAAFGGAAAFGVETFAPRLSRRLNGLLAACDWLAPEAPVPGRMRVHGGIHTLPYPLDPPLRVAAAIGFARSPRLLRGLLGGR
jgi:hypothetical protein